MSMDELDRRIINELQENFPVEADPYGIMARNLGIDADLLWQRVAALVESGVIRRMGFSIDSRKMGYASTLAAIRVPPERIEEAAAWMAQRPQITHSYLRNDAFNIWFTLIAEDEKAILAVLCALSKQFNLADDAMMNLPVKKLFKLDARFK